MRRYLIHTSSVGGHQLEYLHHLYLGALERHDDKFFFLLPQRFEKDKTTLVWPSQDNIHIIIMPEEEVPAKNCGIVMKAWINARTIGKYTKKYNITDVAVISMIEYLPFLPLFVKPSVRVRGIIYRIYLYEWKQEGWLKKALDAFKYWMMSRCKEFDKVFILNDTSSACCLQRIFRKRKFCFLPDPVASPKDYQPKNIRQELGISEEKKMILHAGGMISYKGTIDILRALSEMTREECEHLVVVFAGQTDKIQEKFDYYFNLIKERGINVKLVGGFLPFEKLADLFYSCDLVLIPYKTKSQSSGIVGHAAFYGKPVTVVAGGVIGKMVKRWHLGYTIKKSLPEEIKNFLKNMPEEVYAPRDYLTTHSVEAFYNTILN